MLVMRRNTKEVPQQPQSHRLLAVAGRAGHSKRKIGLFRSNAQQP